MTECKKINATVVAAALCVAVSGWTTVQAQQTFTEQPSVLQVHNAQQNAEATTTEPSQPQLTGKESQLIGCRVTNPQGERLGRITDVVAGFDNQHASYCVLKVRTGVFAKARYVDIPVAAFQSGADNSSLVLNASRANLANARQFAANEWPSGINNVWGAEPNPQATPLPPSEVYGLPSAQSPVVAGAQPIIDSSWNWDQFPAPRTASQAIDQAHYEMIYGLPLNSH